MVTRYEKGKSNVKKLNHKCMAIAMAAIMMTSAFCGVSAVSGSEKSATTETIENKEKYILNNWKERQTYLNNKYMRCSMESHISHILADLFTARPKAYSKKGLNHLLKLRLLKVNGTDIKKLYLNKLINPSEINECNTQTKINVNKIIFPTDTKTNKYLNNFYNTGMDIFDYIQKEEISFI